MLAAGEGLPTAIPGKPADLRARYLPRWPAPFAPAAPGRARSRLESAPPALGLERSFFVPESSMPRAPPVGYPAIPLRKLEPLRQPCRRCGTTVKLVPRRLIVPAAPHRSE